MPVDIRVPAVLAVALEQVQQLGIGRHKRSVLAAEREPLAALAPVLPHAVAHARAEAPRIRLLRVHRHVCNWCFTCLRDWDCISKCSYQWPVSKALSVGNCYSKSVSASRDLAQHSLGTFYIALLPSAAQSTRSTPC